MGTDPQFGHRPEGGLISKIWGVRLRCARSKPLGCVFVHAGSAAAAIDARRGAEGRMPRGGKRGPDGYSPYKTPEGRELKLQKSTKSRTGYYRIVKVGNLFYPKLKLDDVGGSGSQKLFGKGSKEPRDAAILLADYLDQPYELPSAPPRQPHSSQLTARQEHDKKMKRLDALREEACSLLGVPAQMSPEEAAREAARAAEFQAWREACVAQPVSLLVEVGDHGDFHAPCEPA